MSGNAPDARHRICAVRELERGILRLSKLPTEGEKGGGGGEKIYAER
jgi:hypothetical protein